MVTDDEIVIENADSDTPKASITDSDTSDAKKDRSDKITSGIFIIDGQAETNHNFTEHVERVKNDRKTKKDEYEYVEESDDLIDCCPDFLSKCIDSMCKTNHRVMTGICHLSLAVVLLILTASFNSFYYETRICVESPKLRFVDVFVAIDEHIPTYYEDIDKQVERFIDEINDEIGILGVNINLVIDYVKEEKSKLYEEVKRQTIEKYQKPLNKKYFAVIRVVSHKNLKDEMSGGIVIYETIATKFKNLLQNGFCDENSVFVLNLKEFYNEDLTKNDVYKTLSIMNMERKEFCDWIMKDETGDCWEEKDYPILSSLNIAWIVIFIITFITGFFRWVHQCCPDCDKESK